MSLSISNFAFSPSSLTIKVGTTIKVTNNDQTVHTWTSTAGPVGWNSGDLNPGASFSFTFNTAGSYSYECAIHTFMTGTIMVTP